MGGAAYMLPMSVDLGPNTLPSQYHPLAPRGVVVSWATVPALFSLLHPRHSHLAATTARKRRTARCSGPRARSTGAESGPHDRRARAPTSAGAASHGAGPAPAGPLPQGTQTTRREPRRRRGERAAPRVISSSAVHGRDDRCEHAPTSAGAASHGAGPAPQGHYRRAHGPMGAAPPARRDVQPPACSYRVR